MKRALLPISIVSLLVAWVQTTSFIVNHEPTSTASKNNNQTYFDLIHATRVTDADNLAFSNGEKKDSCSGSFLCRWNTDHLSCKIAYEKYDPDAFYARYTSYVNNFCTAIFSCEPTQFFSGFEVQRYFDHIYENQPCRICGIHYFNQTDKPLNSCYVKLDYCDDCHEEGGPSSQSELSAAGLSEAQTNGTITGTTGWDAVTTLSRLSSPTAAVIRNTIDTF